MVADEEAVGLLTGRAGDTWAAIASPVLAQFVDDAGNGEWRGFPRGGFAWQNLTNPALREALGLAEDETGMRLTRVLPHGTAAGALRQWQLCGEAARRGLVLLEAACATGQTVRPDSTAGIIRRATASRQTTQVKPRRSQ